MRILSIAAVVGLALAAGAGARVWVSAAPMVPGPEVVRLEPRPFSHRLNGDWRFEGRPVDPPRAEVKIPAPVWIMAYPVSVAEYMGCVADGACAAPGGPPGDTLPVTGVSWLDANAYAHWLLARDGPDMAAADG
ncbi:SUMF1/EgtB/PvdO family nonheme iron enzyme [Paenirhodobacter sp.]|uniref:SUMF1/EgtB/PvdO family nonheme iron enzyme n=1 Tax=Paenirhodobacter sp. TaxID=1965326 RepID=UPI003B3DE52A